MARGRSYRVNTVAKVMREAGIRASVPRRFARTTDSEHGLPVAENALDRQFDVEYGRRDGTKRDTFEYIEAFYNRIRRHSSLGYVSPDEYERTNKSS